MTANTSKGHQWNQKTDTRLTGGNNYQMRGLAPSTLPPMNNMMGTPVPMGMQQQQGMMGMNTRMMGQPAGFQMQQQQQPMFGGMNQMV